MAGVVDKQIARFLQRPDTEREPIQHLGRDVGQWRRRGFAPKVVGIALIWNYGQARQSRYADRSQNHSRGNECTVNPMS